MNEFGEIRTVIIDNEPWFVGRDVANILGYSNSRQAISTHVDDEDKKDGVTICDSIGREQKPVLINESGLYSLIFGSKMESAIKFKNWVTKEVLPCIRKNGIYATDNVIDIDSLSTELKAIIVVDKRVTQVEQKVNVVEKKLEDFRNDMPLLAIEIDKITEAVKKKGVAVLGGKNSNAYKNSSLRTKLYQDLHRDVRRQFGVLTYKAIKRNQCEQVLAMVDSYKPPIFLDALISNENSQMSISL